MEVVAHAEFKLKYSIKYDAYEEASKLEPMIRRSG